jgi:hypothetical protein
VLPPACDWPGRRSPLALSDISSRNKIPAYQGTTLVVPQARPLHAGFSLCRRIPQGLKALRRIMVTASGTPEGMP